MCIQLSSFSPVCVCGSARAQDMPAGASWSSSETLLNSSAAGEWLAAEAADVLTEFSAEGAQHREWGRRGDMSLVTGHLK